MNIPLDLLVLRLIPDDSFHDLNRASSEMAVSDTSVWHPPGSKPEIGTDTALYDGFSGGQPE